LNFGTRRGNARHHARAESPTRSFGATGAAICLCLALTACSTTEDTASIEPITRTAELDTAPAFTEAEYGVPASERVTTAVAVPKGGGRAFVGKPYQVAGRWYTPAEDPDYDKSGLASWYGPNFHGRKTANGEIYDQYHLSAAHPTFPLPSYARVTNEKNGKSVLVRVNDRGPFSHNRIIDVSSKAAELLDFKQAGVASVNVEYVGPARMDGQDMPFLMASFIDPARGPNAVPPEGQIATGVMIASNDASPLPGVATDAAQPTYTALALASASGPASYQSFGSLVVPASLPQIGPIPPDRPGMLVSPVPLGAPAAPAQATRTAYAADAEPDPQSAFAAILANEAELTPERIVDWKKQLLSN
jgi:rare lipoprotein A